jgi:multicomponent Na+:H+ antiporter subunit B
VGEKMKSMSLIAYIVIVLFGGLFVYVAEDIPAFGDPNSPANKYVNLSITIKGGGEDLDEGVLPAELEEKIKERGFPLPQEYEVVKKSDGWDVWIPKGELYYPEPEKYYFIKREGERLWVYRYSAPVRWEERTEEEIGVPNMVTAGLADYRGYDTLGETTVIFTAGISVVLLLRRRGRL